LLLLLVCLYALAVLCLDIMLGKPVRKLKEKKLTEQKVNNEIERQRVSRIELETLCLSGSYLFFFGIT